MKPIYQPITHFCFPRDGKVELPKGWTFQHVRFSRIDGNLVIRDENDHFLFVRDFFYQNAFPILCTVDGRRMLGGLAAVLVTMSDDVVSALMSCSQPIGSVTPDQRQSTRPADKNRL